MKSGDMVDPLLERYSSRLKDCIAACMSYLPSHRPSATNLLIYTQQQKIERLVQLKVDQRATVENSREHVDEKLDPRKGWEKERELLESHYKKIKDESDKAWIELHDKTSRKAEEEKVRADQLQKDKEELQKSYNELKGKVKARLEILMELYRDIGSVFSDNSGLERLSVNQE